MSPDRVLSSATPHSTVSTLASCDDAPTTHAQPASRDATLMGIRMDDLHAPTVSAGPTTGGSANGVPKEQLSLQELIAERGRVEMELRALGQVLDSVRMAAGA
jgi:hypothetical protein